jgi:signal transduction histidine kinase
MFNSIRTKLTVTYLALILAVMVLTSFFLLNILEQYYLYYHSETVKRAANLVAEFSSGYMQGTPDIVTVSNLAEDFARQIGSRVIITDHRQRVVGDSLRVGGLLGSSLNREEIAKALDGEHGQSIQFSEQSNQWVMQIAVPIKIDETVLGSVFISSSLSLIYQVLEDIRKVLQLATALAILLAAILGTFFAHQITVPIESLTQATEQMSRGDLNQRVRVRSQDEIGRLAAQFNHMSGRMQEMTRQLRDFVANASHEMRTPLTSLNILVKSLREYPLDVKEREEFLADIDMELERLIHLVESLLDLTRLDRLAMEDTMQAVDIVPTVVNTLEMLKNRAEDKGIMLQYTVPNQAPPVFVVIHQIKQVVFNLVDNAIKYTSLEGTVSVDLYQEAGQLMLSVTDTGSGIPAEHREKIFERFYRIDKARSREQGGTGLGLAIVKEIVIRHGGRIWVEDHEVGQGAKFILTLPLAASMYENLPVINKN